MTDNSQLAYKHENLNDADKTGASVDIRTVMAEIRAKIKSDLEKHDLRRPFKPYLTGFDKNSSREAGEVTNSEELHYLSTHHPLGSKLNLDGVTTHRKDWRGKAVVWLKKKLLPPLWNHLLKYYAHSEREWQMHLVRLLGDMSTYIDARDAGNFWELIRKVDYDVTKSLERIERIGDENSASLRSTEERLSTDVNKALTELQELRTKVAEQDAKLKALDAVALGVERVVGEIESSAKQTSSNSIGEVPNRAEHSYVLHQNRFRGSEDSVKERLKIYPPIFAGASKPILEIGAGRGELQELFKESGIKAYGVDSDSGMVARAREQGVDVREEDGLKHLLTVSDQSLGGVLAIQVVEHIPWQTLQELFALCARKVVPGGKIVFETINPASLFALSSAYFRDPTHVWPLHPETLSYMMTLSGLKVIEIKNLSEIPEGAKLSLIPVEEYMTPRWALTVERLNRNLTRLNDLLYGFQDYCIIAEVV